MIDDNFAGNLMNSVVIPAQPGWYVLRHFSDTVGKGADFMCVAREGVKLPIVAWLIVGGEAQAVLFGGDIIDQSEDGVLAPNGVVYGFDRDCELWLYHESIDAWQRHLIAIENEAIEKRRKERTSIFANPDFYPAT